MVKSNMIKKVSHEFGWITYIKARIRDNQNFLGITTGSTGSGKSYACIKIAELIDSTFKVEEGVIFTFEECLKKINDAVFLAKEWKIIVWDEPQIQMSNRSWQSPLNKFINQILSTFRAQNIIILWATPYKDFLDSQSMKLTHAQISSKGWNKSTKITTLLPRLLQYNPDKKRIYPHKLMLKDDTGVFTPINQWRIGLPSHQNIEKYEKIKAEFMKKTNERVFNQINSLADKENNNNNGSSEEKVLELYNKYGYDLNLIQEKGQLRITRGTIARILSNNGFFKPKSEKIFAPSI